MSINENSMTSGKLTVDNFLSVIEQFDKAHKEPVQKVFIVNPDYYDEAKKLFDGTSVKVVKSQSIDPKVVAYLMDKESADECLRFELGRYRKKVLQYGDYLHCKPDGEAEACSLLLEQMKTVYQAVVDENKHRGVRLSNSSFPIIKRGAPTSGESSIVGWKFSVEFYNEVEPCLQKTRIINTSA